MNKSAESRARQFGSETQMSYGLEKVSAGVNAVISTPSTSLREDPGEILRGERGQRRAN